MSHTTGGNVPRQTTLRSPLGRVRGRGAAKAGVQHWWMQRVTSVALLPLCIWFIVSLALSPGMSHAEALAWIGTPMNAALLLALIGMTFHHTAAGLQVIIEDYARHEMGKLIAIMAVKFVCAMLALVAALAVLRIAV
jgi:succinate dehydrogenase / fumarate reductase membrane anchor subunit